MPGGPAEGGPEALDPQEALALLDSERERTGRLIVPDDRLLYGVWGLTWLLGFLLTWSAETGTGPVVLPLPVAYGLFSAGIVGAVVVTAVHIARRTTGVRGASSSTVSSLGWAWVLGFATFGAVMTGAARAGAPPEVMGLLAPALSGLVVGLLYLGGAAAWHDRTQHVVGVVLLVASAAGVLAGFPTNQLVMGLLGGGGFLVAAGVGLARGRSS